MRASPAATRPQFSRCVRGCFPEWLFQVVEQATQMKAARSLAHGLPTRPVAEAPLYGPAWDLGQGNGMVTDDEHACPLTIEDQWLGTMVFEPTGFITYSGLNLAVYESAGTKGPGVLLVHGNTSSAHSYARVLGSSFGDQVRVAAVDLPGFGRSDNAASYDAAFLAGAIVATAEALDMGVFVGSSLGGDLLLQASSQLQAKGYFVFGTAPLSFASNLPPPFLTPGESYAREAVNFGFAADLDVEQLALYVTAFFRPGFHPIPNFFFLDGERTDPNTRGAVTAAMSGLDPTFQDEVAIVKNLQVPVALLLGGRDAFVRPDYLESLASDIPNLWRNGIITISDTGHAVHWEKTDRFVRLLRNFIRDLD